MKIAAFRVGLFAFITCISHSAYSTIPVSKNKLYAGVFTGISSSNKISIIQYGTGFFLDGNGGPLAVNGFGQLDRKNAAFIGAQIGYQWPSITTLNGIAPAIELEGYYLNKRSFQGHDIDNNTTRLNEHDFLITLPVTSKVFLSNFILNFQLENQQKLSPFIGVGIGAAVIDIKNADSTQTSPLEVGINHFNSNPNSSDTAFAAQLKFGTTYQITQHISAFFEYRWLYTASSHYLFGSTVYATHVETAPWKVNLGRQQYNMGLIGMRYSA